jgi:hypothetical protein
MKGLLLALLGTLAGVGMIAVGLAGATGAFDDKSSSGAGPEADVTNFAGCKGSDPRFREFASFDLSGDGGSATVLVTCQGDTLEATLVGTGLFADKQRTVALWLYRNRSVSKLLNSTPQEAGDPSTFVSGPLPKATEDYRKWVVTEEPYAFNEHPTAPTGPVLLEGAIGVN